MKQCDNVDFYLIISKRTWNITKNISPKSPITRFAQIKQKIIKPPCTKLCKDQEI